jgi:radical SAM-linked protein
MRIRFRFTKLGKVRFTSHRDVARIWERAMRRAALPVALTEGFSPRPKVHFGLALSTGYESLGEYLDVDLRDPDGSAVELGALPARLSALLPDGLTVEVAAVIDRSETSLQQAVATSTWRIELPGLTPGELGHQCERLLAAERLEVTRERKGQPVTDDLRPAIVDLVVVDDGSVPSPVAGSDRPTSSVLHAELATHPRSVRPAELLGAFDPPQADAITVGGRVCRLHQWIIADGAKREPLTAEPATPATHAQARAS